MEEKLNQDVDVAEGGKIEEQIDAHPMSALMEDELSFRRLKRGDIVDGVIVSVTPTEVLVDVSAKSEGVVPAKELERLGREGLESLEVGAEVAVYVIRPEDRDGNLILSIRRAEEAQDWKKAQALFESSDLYEGQVAGFNKGGLIVRLGRLRGFIPASQLSPQHQGSSQQQPEERWSRLVGSTVRVKIIEIDRKRKRLIMSERAAQRSWREAQKVKLLDELRVGEVRVGTVSSLSDFGAFVDLGGADGLVHLSELSWNRAAKPRDLLRVGQKVEVYVLNVDSERKRIALSMKRLEPEPWETVESRYYVGQLVEGTVTRLANFGAFVLVSDEIEGLIHISELSPGRIDHPREVVRERDKVVMRIIRIDPKRRRMGLSLKRVADPAYADLDWRNELALASQARQDEEPEEPLEEEQDLALAEAGETELEAGVEVGAAFEFEDADTGAEYEVEAAFKFEDADVNDEDEAGVEVGAAFEFEDADVDDEDEAGVEVEAAFEFEDADVDDEDEEDDEAGDYDDENDDFDEDDDDFEDDDYDDDDSDS